MSEYRLDELSELSGVSVRNIRAYRERGLLDPPRREGRSAFYGDHHLSQLRTINELLRKGFTSAHIADFLASTRRGHDLTGLLGLREDTLGGPRRPEVAVDIDPDSEDATRLRRYGLAQVVDGRLTMVNPHIAEAIGGTEQLRYVKTILRVADGVAELLDELAESVVTALGESPLASLGDHDVPLPDDVVELGRRVVSDQLEDALRRHLVAAATGHPNGIASHGQPG